MGDSSGGQFFFEKLKCISSIQKNTFGEIESLYCREVVPFLEVFLCSHYTCKCIHVNE